MQELHVVLAVLGVLTLALALTSRAVRELPLSEPLVALVAGTLLGPHVLGLLVLTPDTEELVLLEGARVLLAGSVMAAALRFPVHSLRPLVRPLLLLLAVVMPVAALVTGAAALALGLPLALAAVVGACLAPTDPVLAASVVTGEPAERDLPGRVRRVLTAESGANDGLALVLVGLAVAAALPGEGPGDVVGRIVWEVTGGTLVGIVLGTATGYALRAATRRHELEPGPELLLSLLLAVATLGVARTASTGGVLAVFVAGLAYNRVLGEEERGGQDSIDEAINRYAVLPVLVALGSVLPWDRWAELGPPALAFVAAVLVLRRPPLVLAVGRLLGLRLRDTVVVAWFGPVGLSAVFYLAHVRHEGVTDPRVFTVGSLAVAASVLAFGLTASPGRRLYARVAGPQGGR
ncbi:cation:proton antiporter [Actinotalea sp. AC32]|nr:cation:proton antiporter [Actinotalea sp. AC32]